MLALRTFIKGWKGKILLTVIGVFFLVKLLLFRSNCCRTTQKVQYGLNMSQLINYSPKTHKFESIFNLTQGLYLNTCNRKSKLSTLVFVHSHPSRSSERLKIRNSWGSFRLRPWNDAAVFFVIGSYVDEKTHRAILDEERLYKDLIKGSFPENQKFDDIKSVAWIDWTVKLCPQIPINIMSHDTAILDLIKLNHMLKHRKIENNHVILLNNGGHPTYILSTLSKIWVAKDFKNRWPWSENSSYYKPDAQTVVIDWTEEFGLKPLTWESIKKTYARNITPEALEPAYKSNFRTTSFENFVLVPKNFCNPGLKQLVIVHSAVYNSDLRKIIRKTWASKTMFDSLGIKAVFILGRSPDFILERRVLKEFQRYNDIVVGDYIDHYQNLTYKSFSWMKWAKVFCPKVEDYVKVDDDVFVDVFKTGKFLRSPAYKTERSTKIFCNVFSASQPIRKPIHKNFLMTSEYPHKFFPDYCGGLFFIISKTITTKMLDNFKKNPSYIWVDDVFITGIMAKRVKVGHYKMNYNWVHDPKIHGDWSNIMFRLIEGSKNHIYRFIFWKYVLYLHNASHLLEKGLENLPLLKVNKKKQPLKLNFDHMNNIIDRILLETK